MPQSWRHVASMATTLVDDVVLGKRLELHDLRAVNFAPFSDFSVYSMSNSIVST
jgi:hypothetical protein